MKKNSLLIALICFWAVSCKIYNDTISYTTTVSVVDISGNPLKGRLVKVFSYPNESVSARTDNSGKAVLYYHGYISDSYQGTSKITVEEDSLFKSVNFAEHLSGATGRIRLSFTLKTESRFTFESIIKLRVTDVELGF